MFLAGARSRSLSLSLAVGAWILTGTLPAFAALQTVTNTDDSGPGSLRAAVAAANAGDTIQFNVSGIITLTSGELLLTKGLTITGPGASQLAVSGGHASRIFTIGFGANVNISGLTIENGNASESGGGGIYNQGGLTLTNSTILGNSATAGSSGGGIYNSGALTLTNSTFAGNSTSNLGGAVYNFLRSTATVINSTFSGNSAPNGYGGGIYNSGALTLTNSTFAGNSASNFGGGLLNDPAGALTVKSTLLANNGGGNCRLGGTTSSQGYNLSDDNTCSAFTAGGDANNVVPGAGLDPNGLQNNGGSTPTIALLFTSPAVDHVPVASCTDIAGNQITTDQRGISRPQGPACDSGAFELVESGPAITKSFGATTILLNGTTTLTFTLSLPLGNETGLSNVGFVDVLPAGLVVSSPNGLSGSCGTGVITANPGAGAVSLSGAALSNSLPSCIFSVNVTGTTLGPKYNSVTATSAQATGSTGTAALVVLAIPPTVQKTFAPALIATTETATLSFTLNNPNTATTLTGVSLVDFLPGGLIVATPNGLSGNCGTGSTVTATAGASTIALSNGTLNAGASCSFSVQVTATAPGSIANTAFATANESGPGDPVTATLIVSDFLTAGTPGAFQINYASNLDLGDGVVHIINTGASAGNICVNIYGYVPDEQQVLCCACNVSPNSLHTFPLVFGPNALFANSPIISAANTSRVVIKLVATAPNGTVCPNPSTPLLSTRLAAGLQAWGTRAYVTNTADVVLTETSFVSSNLSVGEGASLTGGCAAIGNGGICPGCQADGSAVSNSLKLQLP